MRAGVMSGALAVVALAGLAGCDGVAGDVDRAGKRQLAIDIYGCPDLGGVYVFQPPAASGISSEGSFLANFEIRGGVAPSRPASALVIRRVRPGIFEFRFLVDDSAVMRQLEEIRRHDRERYREWYRLLHEPGRSAYIARLGEQDHALRLRDLGPQTEVVHELRAGTSAACRDGWLELPRTHGGPLRLTLGEDGSILGRAKELNTFDIPIWCGDGCKDLKIPTGTDTRRLRWSRGTRNTPWRAESTGFAFERPLDDIEAEQRAQEALQRKEDARRFLGEAEIRDRLDALAPPGTRLERVEVRGGKVHVRYVAPIADTETLLQRVAAAGVSEAGAARMIEGPLEVQRSVTSSRPEVRTVDFVLTESPLVRRRPPSGPSSGPSSGAATAAAEPAAGMAVLARADSGKTGPAPAAQPAPAATAAAATAARTPPPGLAGPFAIRRRVGALFPAGCRVVDVRYGGASVELIGQAEQQRCVSDGLRALDAGGSRPELLSIARDGDRSYTFRILIAPSALTRP